MMLLLSASSSSLRYLTRSPNFINDSSSFIIHFPLLRPLLFNRFCNSTAFKSSCDKTFAVKSAFRQLQLSNCRASTSSSRGPAWKFANSLQHPARQSYKTNENTISNVKPGRFGIVSLASSLTLLQINRNKLPYEGSNVLSLDDTSCSKEAFDNRDSRRIKLKEEEEKAEETIIQAEDTETSVEGSSFCRREDRESTIRSADQ